MRLFFILMITLLILSCDTVQDSYTTYQQAKDSQLFKRGWLPDILPTTTIDFSISNELDSNTSHGSFNIPKADIAQFIDKLSHVSDNQYRYQNGTTSRWMFTISNSGYVEYQLYRQ